MNEATLKQFLPKMGRMLKLLREKSGRNQCTIAEQAGISTSMLSQIERGVVSPSIDTLLLVCHSLGLDPSELFKGLVMQKPVSIQHPGGRLYIEQKGLRYEQLITNLNGPNHSELFLLEVAPGASTTLSDKGHEGVEMGYVLNGEALLVAEDVEYKIGVGDSVSFQSHLPHMLYNKGDTKFRAVWSISPPHVDYFTNTEI